MLITNFDEKDLENYKLAISLFENKTGNKWLTIQNDAYDFYGNLLTNTLSLHGVESTRDLSIFWNIYDRLKHVIKIK